TRNAGSRTPSAFDRSLAATGRREYGKGRNSFQEGYGPPKGNLKGPKRVQPVSAGFDRAFASYAIASGRPAERFNLAMIGSTLAFADGKNMAGYEQYRAGGSMVLAR